MKKTFSTLVLFTSIFAITPSFAANGDAGVNEVKANDLRRILIAKYHLNEYQAVKLKPIVVTYVANVDKNKKQADQGFKEAFFKIVGKPYTSI